MSAETDQVQDRHIAFFNALPRPRELRDELAADKGRYGVFTSGRARIEVALSGRDDRMVVVVGTCSIHDPQFAIDYAGRGGGARRRPHRGHAHLLREAPHLDRVEGAD